MENLVNGQSGNDLERYVFVTRQGSSLDLFQN